MDVIRISGFAIAASLCVLVLRKLQPEMGMTAAMGAGALLLALCAPVLRQVVDGITELASSGGVSPLFLSQLMKVAGVSLLMDFSAQTCRDAGENGLAVKAELAGRVMLLALALPAMRTLLSQLMALTV